MREGSRLGRQSLLADNVRFRGGSKYQRVARNIQICHNQYSYTITLIRITSSLREYYRFQSIVHCSRVRLDTLGQEPSDTL